MRYWATSRTRAMRSSTLSLNWLVQRLRRFGTDSLSRLSFLNFKERAQYQQMGSLMSPSHDEASFPYWVAEAVIEPENDLPELVVARNRFMRRIRSSREKLIEWKQSIIRAQSLNSEHVFDHFAAITGHSIADLEACKTVRLPSAKPSVVSEKAYKALGLSAFTTMTSTRLNRMGSKVIASAVSAYLVLIMVGSWTPSIDPMEYTKGLPEYSWLELGANPRGYYIPREFYVTRRYKVALNKLLKANTTVFGYLPGFKQDLLNEGILEMEDAVDFQRMGGYVYPQALLFLADAYIRAGQVEKAVPLIEEIIQRNERRALEARLLRKKLQKQGFID